jgi:hypothetical protein
VSLWSQIFLGVIALATLTTAIVQLGVLIAAGRMARRDERLVERVEQEMSPAFGHINAIGREASRAVGLATTQIERVDALVSDLSQRVEEIVATVQSTIAVPAREGRAMLNALKAAFDVVREARRRPRTRRRAEDDDVLFI